MKLNISRGASAEGAQLTVAVVAIFHASLCLIAFCAVLVLLAFGECSALGLQLGLIALAIAWSGIPLLVLAIRQLRRGAGFAMKAVSMLLGVVPSVAFLAVSLPEPIVFVPVGISLVLYLLLMLVDRR